MSKMNLIQTMGFSMPMFASLICCVLLLGIYNRNSNEYPQRRLLTIMLLTHIAACMCWFGIILYVVSYDAFIWFNSFFFLALMLYQVLLYHFIFIITGTGTCQKFNAVHYAIPTVLVLVMAVWSLLTPYDVQYYIVESRGEYAPGYLWYSRFFSSRVPIFIAYNTLYPLLGLKRVPVYRREVVSYSADKQRASAGWIYILITLTWLTLPLSVAMLFVHNSDLYNSVLTVPCAFLPVFQYLVISYNLLTGNYVIIQPPTEEEGRHESGKKGIPPIKRASFERYIRTKQPYLNPQLKITDICADFGENRTYISGFINKTYGMSFSRYINQYRLEEFSRLRSLPENKQCENIDLVLMVGFSSYRSYLRAKNNDDKARVLKKFE